MKFLPSLPWLKWLKHLFVALHFLVVSTILVASLAIYIAFRPDSLEIVNTYLLEPLGIHYTRAEGSLLEGFTLHDVQTETMEAKRVELQYSLVKMLEGEHVVDSVKIDGLRIHLSDFISEDESIWPWPTFQLRYVSITNLQLISEYPIELDLKGSKGSYDGENLSFENLDGSIKSRYASGAIHGKVVRNTLKGVCDLYPNLVNLEPYSGQYTRLPSRIRIGIEALSSQKAQLKTQITALSLNQDPTLHAEAIKLDFLYRYADEYFDVNAQYRLIRGEDAMQMSQKLRYSLEGITHTAFDGVITSTQLPLPSKMLHGEFTDSSDGIEGTLKMGSSVLKIASEDYERFKWHLKSDHENLDFLPSLHETLRKSPLKLEGSGLYTLAEGDLSGTLEALDDFGHFKGNFSTLNGHHTLAGTVVLNLDAPLWANWSHKPPQNLSVSLDDANGSTRVQISGDSLAFNGSLKQEKLKGSGNYLETFFDLSGSLAESSRYVDVDLLIPSLFNTFSKLQPYELHQGEYYDAEVRSKTRIDFTDTLRVESVIKIPWYAAVLDTQSAFGGTDGEIFLSMNEGNITVDKYRIEFLDHPITTDKTSYLHVDENGNIIIDEFWVFDTLKLDGMIQNDLRTKLHLYSNRFSYKGPIGNAHASADITYERDGEANQKLYGSLNFLDALISYLPIQQFKVMDDDIIIVQDVRPPSDAKFSMNLQITASEPIRFKTKELDLGIDPDITLWKDPADPMQMLGILRIPSGTATTSGKHFTIKPSAIYFGGDVPLNPYLNLTIGHEVDYNKILIYITHTLDSPIFLFSSDPVMSQNDIMSYILFGAPANSTEGDSSTSTIRADATNFMLGAGLKGIINGATKLQIDTMNILTTAEGGMGFEVGARLNKDLRVLYKNDTVSSVLLQYTVNRWLRLDADIHELGQGINAIYIKDFRDFLPHNKPIKKK